MYMQPDRGIVRMDRWSDGISTISDDRNNLSHQSTGTNNGPRNPLFVPVKSHLTLR